MKSNRDGGRPSSPPAGKEGAPFSLKEFQAKTDPPLTWVDAVRGFLLWLLETIFKV